MESIKVGKNKRRDMIAEMAKVGEVIVRDGYLSISRLQRHLARGYTYATNIIDYLVNTGELHRSVRIYFSLSVFHRVVENKTYRHRTSVTSPGYSNPQKAVMLKSILQLAQVR